MAQSYHAYNHVVVGAFALTLQRTDPEVSLGGGGGGGRRGVHLFVSNYMYAGVWGGGWLAMLCTKEQLKVVASLPKISP